MKQLANGKKLTVPLPLSPYALPMGSPVLMCATFTYDVRYRHRLCIVLCKHYTMSGTDVGYRATRSTARMICISS
eukprot:956821-Rhodomonas_salina.1